MKAETTTLTERGQVSVPSSIRRALAMKPGQELIWKKVSADEVRVQVVRSKMAQDAHRCHRLREETPRSARLADADQCVASPAAPR